MTAAPRVLLPALGALLLLGAGAAWVCPAGHCGVPGVDANGLATAHAWRGPALDAAAVAFTWLGSLVLLLPLALLFAWHQSRRGGWVQASLLPLTLAVTAAVSHLAKYLVLRPRPELFPPLTAMPADASYPSAHAMQITALVLALLLRPGSRPGALAWCGGILLIAGVAASRVHLQVHYPSDVLLGVLVAGLLAVSLRGLPFWQGQKP